MRGMKWENLTSIILGAFNCYGMPFAVIIHCGGNDIGGQNTPCGYLMYQMKVTFVFMSYYLVIYFTQIKVA